MSNFLLLVVVLLSISNDGISQVVIDLCQLLYSEDLNQIV